MWTEIPQDRAPLDGDPLPGHRHLIRTYTPWTKTPLTEAPSPCQDRDPPQATRTQNPPLCQDSRTETQLASRCSRWYASYLNAYIMCTNRTLSAITNKLVVKPSQHLFVLPSVQSAWHCLFWRLICQCREVKTSQP